MEPIRVIWSGERAAHLVDPGGRPAKWYAALRVAGIAGVAEIMPGSKTVLIRVDDDADPDEVVSQCLSALEERGVVEPRCPERVVEIPICSNADLAPDLEDIARGAGLSGEAATDLLATGEYTVRFLGFAPGFPYIDGLTERLHTARLDTPRTRVRGGSIGIAGARIGIYPHDGPGGWRLIGATPLRMFEPDRDQPALLVPGDRIRFRRIARNEFDAIKRAGSK